MRARTRREEHRGRSHLAPDTTAQCQPWTATNRVHGQSVRRVATSRGQRESWHQCRTGTYSYVVGDSPAQPTISITTFSSMGPTDTTDTTSHRSDAAVGTQRAVWMWFL